MKLNYYLKSLLQVCLLPLFLIIDVVQSSRNIVKKVLYLLVVLVFFVSVWYSTYGAIVQTVRYQLFESGVTDQLHQVKVSGTSMMPTIQDGADITLSSPKKFPPQRGDIISFQNQETDGLFYLKRIVGLPGEVVSIKNGVVAINGKILAEDYTLNPETTYGNTFLLDCESKTVPENHFWVMGDNRLVSLDSRVVGFVNVDDIEGVIKTNIVESYLPSTVQQQILASNINPSEFLKALNNKRVSSQLSPLVTHTELNSLAQKRATQIKDHFSDWKTAAIPAEKALQDSGYRFNLIHEYVTFGYLDETEIVNQIFESPNQKDQFLSSQFTEVGVGLTQRKDGECQYPLISVIISWPSVPTYDQSVIKSWLDEIAYTNKTLSDLQTYVGLPSVNQEKLRETISSVAQQNQIATRIYNQMKNREWLTDKDYADIKYYDKIVDDSNRLFDELFPQNVQGITAPETESQRRL